MGVFPLDRLDLLASFADAYLLRSSSSSRVPAYWMPSSLCSCGTQMEKIKEHSTEQNKAKNRISCFLTLLLLGGLIRLDRYTHVRSTKLEYMVDMTFIWFQGISN